MVRMPKPEPGRSEKHDRSRLAERLLIEFVIATYIQSLKIVGGTQRIYKYGYGERDFTYGLRARRRASSARSKLTTAMMYVYELFSAGAPAGYLDQQSTEGKIDMAS